MTNSKRIVLDKVSKAHTNKQKLYRSSSLALHLSCWKKIARSLHITSLKWVHVARAFHDTKCETKQNEILKRKKSKRWQKFSDRIEFRLRCHYSRIIIWMRAHTHTRTHTSQLPAARYPLICAVSLRYLVLLLFQWEWRAWHFFLLFINLSILMVRNQTIKFMNSMFY